MTGWTWPKRSAACPTSRRAAWRGWRGSPSRTDGQSAGHLLGAAAVVRDTGEAPLTPMERADHECLVAVAAALGAAQCEATMTTGRTMPLEHLLSAVAPETGAREDTDERVRGH